MAETENIEYKSTWRDEFLKVICAFANTNGGKLLVGVNDNGEVIGLKDIKKLMEDIPNKTIQLLGIVPKVRLRKSKGIEYLNIEVESSPVPISYQGSYYVRSGSTKQELKGTALQHFLLKK
jgi:ATP-dependent DNA helicase RecG